jgi:hypothetical protein
MNTLDNLPETVRADVYAAVGIAVDKSLTTQEHAQLLLTYQRMHRMQSEAGYIPTDWPLPDRKACSAARMFLLEATA